MTNDHRNNLGDKVPSEHSKAKQTELTGIRKLIKDRADEVGMTLADLSRAANKNAAYVHQFLYKGTPRRLDEDSRAAMAACLHVDAALLRDAPPALRGPTSIAEDHQPAVAAPEVEARERAPSLVHVFREDQSMAPGLARLSGDGMLAETWQSADFGIWIETPRGRLNTGDLAFVKASRPARIGDQVVVLAAGKMRCIGELKAGTGASISICDGESIQNYERSGIKMLRIVGVAYP